MIKDNFDFNDEDLVLYRVVGGIWRQGEYDSGNPTSVAGKKNPDEIYEIVPFAGNEHLFNTSDDYVNQDILKLGDPIVTYTDNSYGCTWLPYCGCVKFFLETKDNFVVTDDAGYPGTLWRVAVPLRDFDFNDMESTRRAHLVVKNGKFHRNDDELFGLPETSIWNDKWIETWERERNASREIYGDLWKDTYELDGVTFRKGDPIVVCNRVGDRNMVHLARFDHGWDDRVVTVNDYGFEIMWAPKTKQDIMHFNDYKENIFGFY